METPSITVRPTVEAEWRALHALRLRALADAPTAFGQTLAEAQAQPESLWRERARGTQGSRMFVAAAGADLVGLAGMVVEDESTGQLVSMWLAPQHRGGGLAADLVAAALGWARQCGLRRARLYVTDGNHAARRLYLRCGFTDTGRTAPLPSDPSLVEREMALELPAP